MSGVEVQFEFYTVFRKRLGKIADQIPSHQHRQIVGTYRLCMNCSQSTTAKKDGSRDQRAAMGQLSVEGVCLLPGHIAKFGLEDGHPSFAIFAHFIYKTVHVPTKIGKGAASALMLLSRSFQVRYHFNDSAAGNGPMQQEH